MFSAKVRCYLCGSHSEGGRNKEDITSTPSGAASGCQNLLTISWKIKPEVSCIYKYVIILPCIIISNGVSCTNAFSSEVYEIPEMGMQRDNFFNFS
jgi:hypothetical protein